MSCRSPFGNTPHMCRTFQPVAMTLGLGSGSPLFAQTAWTCTTHGIFWASRPDTSPDSHARITCVYCSATPAYICPILPRRASAARKKRMDKQLFSLSLIMILSKISMNVKQIPRFCKIILNDACFFLLLSNIFSSFVFYQL